MMENVQGPVLRPGESGYDGERSGFQTSHRHHPDLVVVAADAADVQAAVAYAAAHDLPVAVQAAGHGLTVAAEEGVLITTSRLDEVTVDPGRRTARIGAGVRWRQVIEAAAPYGLAPVSGSFPDLGAVPYTLGGGLGLMSRTYGYAADHVTRIEAVLADGAPVALAPGDELFAAMLGTRGAFGVVTALEFSLVPVEQLYGGGLLFAASEELVEAYLAWTATLPDTLTSSLALIPTPDRRLAAVRVAFAGDAAEGERLVAPLRQAGKVLDDSLRIMPYTESGTIAQEPSDPHGYAGGGVFLADLPAAAIADSPHVVQVRHLGGALSKPAANVMGHRDAAFLLQIVAGGAWEVPQGLRPLGRFLNFQYGPATADEVRSAFDPADFDRLVRLKAAHDPAHRFRFTTAIPSI
ncbi:FAD-binding oxidoreductase [Nonomuraea sp. NPDC050663]|uniref:FAD-binding oxidoreductase n=1 Tax=Nonomuraea sp. NPDC050663 TaxID=3364370 RepID=UPI0037909705